jgi:hypothetical protein
MRTRASGSARAVAVLFFSRKAFCADAVDCGAVSERGSGEKCLLEAEDGAADKFVQGAGRVLGAGAENEPGAGAGGGGFKNKRSCRVCKLTWGLRSKWQFSPGAA